MTLQLLFSPLTYSLVLPHPTKMNSEPGSAFTVTPLVATQEQRASLAIPLLTLRPLWLPCLPLPPLLFLSCFSLLQLLSAPGVTFPAGR